MKESQKTVIFNGVETRALRHTQPQEKAAKHLGRKALAMFAAMGIGVAAAPHVPDAAKSVWTNVTMSEKEAEERNNVPKSELLPVGATPEERAAGVAKAEQHLRERQQAQDDMEAQRATQLPDDPNTHVQ